MLHILQNGVFEYHTALRIVMFGEMAIKLIKYYTFKIFQIAVNEDMGM